MQPYTQFLFPKKANRLATDANEVNRLSAQFSYYEHSDHLPSSFLRIAKVEYLLDHNGRDEINSDSLATLIISGTIQNLTQQELLVSARPSGCFSNEFFHQKLIRINGIHRNTVLQPGETVGIQWEDRQQVKYWQDANDALSELEDTVPLFQRKFASEEPKPKTDKEKRRR